MKKKGLIISTIVMVVVLIASLTTATYAWFTASSKASVDPIQFSVTSDSDLVIGVAKTNAYKASATNDDFVSGSGMDYTPNGEQKWTGDGGLGFQINTGLSLAALTQAVWTGTNTAQYTEATGITEFATGVDYYTESGGSYTKVTGDFNSGTTYYTQASAYTVDGQSAFNNEHEFVKASGNASTITVNTIDKAIANGYVIDSAEVRGDYLDVCFGVKANKETVTGIALVIGVKATGSATTIGMNAAINYTWKLDNGNWSEVQDIYGESVHHSTVKSTLTTPPSVNFNGKENIAIKDNSDSNITWAGSDAIAVLSVATGMTSANYNDIHQVHLRLFIGGYDSDCTNAASQASATIYLNFIATKAEG